MSGAESAYSPVQPAETGVGAERTATPKSSRGNTPPASLARVGSLDPSRSASMLAEAAPHMEPLIGGAPRKSWTQQAVAAVARLSAGGAPRVSAGGAPRVSAGGAARSSETKVAEPVVNSEAAAAAPCAVYLDVKDEPAPLPLSSTNPAREGEAGGGVKEAKAGSRPRLRRASWLLFYLALLIVNDGVVGVLAAYLARSRLYDYWLHSALPAARLPALSLRPRRSR